MMPCSRSRLRVVTARRLRQLHGSQPEAHLFMQWAVFVPDQQRFGESVSAGNQEPGLAYIFRQIKNEARSVRLARMDHRTQIGAINAPRQVAFAVSIDHFHLARVGLQGRVPPPWSNRVRIEASSER